MTFPPSPDGSPGYSSDSPPTSNGGTHHHHPPVGVDVVVTGPLVPGRDPLLPAGHVGGELRRRQGR